MATQVNAGGKEDCKRGDLWRVNPYNVIVKEELRGRHIAPTDEDIMRLAVSMLENYQQQPVICRRDSEQRLLLTAGFTRTNAARLIRVGFEFLDQHYHDPDFLLKVTLIECNDEQALKNNIVENCHRNETTAIDDAHNQNKLRERYGMSDAEITRLYSYNNSNKVGQLKKLLSLSEAEQVLVHTGDLSVSAAIDLLDIPTEERQEIVTAATKDTGKVDGGVVRSAVRDRVLSDSEEAEGDAIFGKPTESTVEPSKKLTRSMREVKNYFTARLEDESYVVYHDIYQAQLDFMAGKKGERALDNAYSRLPLKKVA